MAEERIDIVVNDKVDGAVAQKLNQIADGADRGANYIKRLQSALSAVNTTALDRLASAMSKADSAQAKLISAQARLTNAQNAGSLAAQKVALAQQKVATEAARTEAAQARAAAATSNAESAQLRLASAQGRAQASAAAAATAQQQLAAATTQAGTAATNAGNGFRAYVAGVQQANGSSMIAASGFQQVAASQNNAVTASNQYARAARQTTAVNANIIAQIQDIGVSLAGGQNPLLVAIQQGSQLSYIASTMDGGLKALLATVGRMALAWAPVIAAIGLFVFALNEASDILTQGAGLEEYIDTLGLTEREVRRLKDTHVTMGDTIKATWQVLSANVLSVMGFTSEEIANSWETLKNRILYYMTAAFIGIGALTVTLVRTIGTIVANIGRIFYNAGVAAANLFLISIELLVNKTIDGINAIGGAVNFLSREAGFGDVVGQLDHINIAAGGVTDGFMELSTIDPVAVFNQSAQNALGNLRAIGAQAQQNARDRLAAQAAEMIADRTPGRGRTPRERVDRTEENRAHALEMVNLQLDNELSRMRLLRQEREIQQRMDQITQQLAQKNITLTDAERTAIEGKVRAIEAYREVQQSMDRIYESVTGPARDYANALQAITDLEAQGAITASQAAEQRVLANRAHEESVNPLFKLQEAMERQERTLGLYGEALDRANYYESIRQAYLERGIVLSGSYVQGVNAEVDALMRRNDAIMQGQYIQTQAAGFIDPAMEQNRFLANYQNIYAEIDRMRQLDLENEGVYQQALYALQARYNEMRLSSASDFFGSLAGVTKNGTGVIGAISKAAAVAQATIDGYVAVQKALASAPPPFNYIAAAAVAIKTGTQVAGIVSTNVGSYATGGQFVVDGKSGVDANNINMNVTRGERVTIETPAQQRAADGAGANPVVNANTKVVNLLDPALVTDAMASEEGERVILNIIQRNPQVLGG